MGLRAQLVCQQNQFTPLISIYFSFSFKASRHKDNIGGVTDQYRDIKDHQPDQVRKENRSFNNHNLKIIIYGTLEKVKTNLKFSVQVLWFEWHKVA